jgi:hypothetical protein
MPPLNQFDAAASLPLDFFSEGTADATPYRVRPIDKRLFDPDEAFKPFDRRFNWKQLAASAQIDDPEDMLRPFIDANDALATVVMGAPGAARRSKPAR